MAHQRAKALRPCSLIPEKRLFEYSIQRMLGENMSKKLVNKRTQKLSRDIYFVNSNTCQFCNNLLRKNIEDNPKSESKGKLAKTQTRELSEMQMIDVFDHKVN